jgi:hypothetical protein
MKVKSATVRIIEFPDGQKHRFELLNDIWRLTHIYNG